MELEIIHREKIELNDSQTKMVISGWGKTAYENSIVERITYLSDGLKIKGYIAYPKETENSKFPCIIWNRGGYKNQGVIDVFNARGIFGNIASWGYVVFASQYRGSPGSEGEEELGGNDINDILNLIPFADEFPFADKNKWGIEGWSRGGMMTLLALLKNHTFKCAVLIGAISDLRTYADENPGEKSFYRELLGGNFENEVEKRTVINKVDKLPDIPYLIMHGGNDKTVSPVQTLNLSKKFLKNKILHRLIIFENGDHYLKNHRENVDNLRKFWFDKYLKGK